jgi:hypothetical protein
LTAFAEFRLFVGPFGPYFEGAAFAASFAFGAILTPACFRYAPPEAAGRVFFAFAKPFLGASATMVVLAGLMRLRSAELGRGGVGRAVLDFAAAVLLFVALTALRSFRQARDAALREVRPGGEVDGVMTLRSHALLRGIRALALLAAALLLLNSEMVVISL